MDKMEIKAGLSADRLTTTLTMTQNGQPIGYMHIDAGELSAFIAALGHVRQNMADQVPSELEPNSRLEVTFHPSWRVPPDQQGLRGLALRHPGLGWLGFRMERDVARQLADWLAKPNI